MKKLFFPFFACIAILACNENDKKITRVPEFNADSAAKVAMADTSNFTAIQWLDSSYLDLGKLKEGKEIEISYRFKNIGDKNLVIQDVTAGCGCTIPEKPEKPYAPGEEGIIKAKFNGSGHGEIRKDIHVIANTKPSNSHTLTFRAEMIK